jgi:ribosomal protein S5
LYNEPDIVVRLGVREDDLSSRWRIAKEGNVGLNIIETERGVALFTHAERQEFTGLVVVNRRTGLVGLGDTEGKEHGSPVFKYTCKLSIMTHARVG